FFCLPLTGYRELKPAPATPSHLGRCLRSGARARRRGHVAGVPRSGNRPRSPRGGEGTPPRAGRRCERRPLPPRNPTRRPTAASPHRTAALGRRGPGIALLHHAVRDGGV